MITLDLTSLQEKLNLEFHTDLLDLKQKVLSRKQGFIDLPYDTTNLQKVLDYKHKNYNKYKTIVLVGIGGSSLGPKCIWQALGTDTEKGVFIVDNIDPDEIDMVNSRLDYHQTLFIIVTKSGTTPETIATYAYFRDRANQLQLDPKDHFVFITDPEKGYLRTIATVENIPVFDIPENVGGRFSVLSNVGLVFGALTGVDIEAMLEGAKSISDGFKSDDNNLNDAFNLAKIQYLSNLDHKNIVVIFPYSTRLKSFGDWYVQLLSESIGKELNLKGERVNVGITPLPAVGATDQHSQLQLFKEGPDDKLIIFIEVANFNKSVNIPNIDYDGLKYLSNHTFNELINTEYKATRQSLTESNKPNLSITIPEINSYYLGQLFQTMELCIAFLGEMYDINTFDQPGVERGKILTKEKLSELN